MVGPGFVLTPATYQEVAETVGTALGSVVLVHEAESHPFGFPHAPTESTTCLSLENLGGIVEFDVSDQVVVVRAGTRLKDLQEELSKHGQCLPFSKLSSDQERRLAIQNGRLTDEIAYNMPHCLLEPCGSWRDWILGMRLVQHDGTLAKCGSKAVKNVAGYDVQKLMIGARHSLAIVIEVTLKTYPIEALPPSSIRFIGTDSVCNWIQRVRRTDFDLAVREAGDTLVAYDKPSSTFWANVDPTSSLPRYPDDWILRSGTGCSNLEFTDETQTRFMKRTKDLFDPSAKLNPGAMGIF